MGSIFTRASNAILSHVEVGIGSLEASARRRLSRYSVIEIEHAVDDVQSKRLAAERERAVAAAERTRLDALAADWGQKAAYAVGKARPDLAEQAIGRQIDAEQEAGKAGERVAALDREVARLTAFAGELAEERTRMAAALAEIDHDAVTPPSGASDLSATEDRVQRAQARFERLMETHRAAAAAAADGAEIDALRRVDDIAARMAAITVASRPESSPKQRGGKRR